MTIHLQTAKGISSLLSCTFSCSVADNGILNDSPDHRKLALPYDCRRIFIARGLRCLHRHSRHVSAKPLCPFDLRFVLSTYGLSDTLYFCLSDRPFSSRSVVSPAASSFSSALSASVRRFSICKCFALNSNVFVVFFSSFRFTVASSAWGLYPLMGLFAKICSCR